MKTSVTEPQLVALQQQIRAEIAALPIGPARISPRAAWLDAAWHCANIALGQRRAQPGSSRQKARELCARIIGGENVPIDELRAVTTRASMREKPRHAAKKSARQLDTEIAHALAKRPGDKRVGKDVAAVFAEMADAAEIGAGENLYLGRGSLGYVGDPREFRFSEIYGRKLPGATYDRLAEIIEEYSERPHDRLGRKLTAREADWMRAQAKIRYEDERRYVENAIRERNS